MASFKTADSGRTCRRRGIESTATDLPQYRSHHYVVNDWRGHHLSAPPRGYHWIQNGGDYLLVAIATGVIASMVLSAY